MQNADFRVKTTEPSAPSTSSVVVVYADASGRLVSKNSASALTQVGTQFTGTVPAANVISGTLLGGAVSGWLHFTGPNNEQWAVPAYRHT